MRVRRRIEDGLSRIGELHVWGEPDLWALAYGSDKYDMLAVAGEMWARGWAVAPVRKPPGIHFMPTPVHEPHVDDYIAALQDSIQAAAKKASGSGVSVEYS
jgi:glutamate/tyrosine decarboxylase-like PLP-dependent enzyme